MRVDAETCGGDPVPRKGQVSCRGAVWQMGAAEVGLEGRQPAERTGAGACCYGSEESPPLTLEARPVCDAGWRRNAPTLDTDKTASDSYGGGGTLASPGFGGGVVNGFASN